MPDKLFGEGGERQETAICDMRHRLPVQMILQKVQDVTHLPSQFPYKNSGEKSHCADIKQQLNCKQATDPILHGTKQPHKQHWAPSGPTEVVILKSETCRGTSDPA